MSSPLLTSIVATLLSDADVMRGFELRRQELALTEGRARDGFEAKKVEPPRAPDVSARADATQAKPLPERRRELDQALGRRFEQLRRRMRP